MAQINQQPPYAPNTEIGPVFLFYFFWLNTLPLFSFLWSLSNLMILCFLFAPSFPAFFSFYIFLAVECSCSPHLVVKACKIFSTCPCLCKRQLVSGFPVSFKQVTEAQCLLYICCNLLETHQPGTCASFQLDRCIPPSLFCFDLQPKFCFCFLWACSLILIVLFIFSCWVVLGQSTSDDSDIF